MVLLRQSQYQLHRYRTLDQQCHLWARSQGPRQLSNHLMKYLHRPQYRQLLITYLGTDYTVARHLGKLKCIPGHQLS